ncbi:P-loop containing nucleoside triphosphate hydrolase protein, partial [Tilletiaria anomala UBC 951]
PHTKARYLLHVGSTPSLLPCREKEFGEVLEKVENAIDESTGQCLYVSGVPGTGKTATCRQVVRTLMKKRADGSRAGLPDFNFVEINGMKISEASQVYSILWDAIGGSQARVSSKSALEKLRQHFERYSERTGTDQRSMTVLLLDEMDQLITSRQDVIYNLFNWPNMQNSKLLVIALANTMDLPQRALSAKVASRLGWQSVQFKPYDDKQLTQIVQARLGIETPTVVIPDKVKETTRGCSTIFNGNAITLMAKKVAVVNGDARRMLDIAR